MPASISATPIRIAVCASWPHACMTPHCMPFQSVLHVLLKGTSTSSVDRQRVHVGAQRHDRAGPAALEHADDAGVRDLLLHLVEAEGAQVRRRRCFAVRTSRLPSSGFWWKSRRQAMTRGSTLVGGRGDGGVEGEGGVGSVHAAILRPPIIVRWSTSNPRQAHQYLKEHPDAVFIDCRSEMEYMFVGHPDRRHDDSLVRRRGMGAEPPLRRPGEEARRAPTSRSAPSCSSAAAATARSRPARRSSGAGFKHVINVVHGFEGELDESHHRNSRNGWRVDGLPWEQY